MARKTAANRCIHTRSFVRFCSSRGRSSAKSSWGKARKAYFRNKIQDDLKHVRKFTTMTSILRSVQDETKHEDNRKSTVSGKEEESKSKSKHDDVFLHRRRPTVYFL